LVVHHWRVAIRVSDIGMIILRRREKNSSAFGCGFMGDIVPFPRGNKDAAETKNSPDERGKKVWENGGGRTGNELVMSYEL